MDLSTYRKIQKFLLASFCVSVAVLTLTIFIDFASMGSAATNGTNAGANTKNTNSTANTSKPPEEGGYGLIIIGGVTFLTSVTSLLGFISTTVLAWRKEKRETETLRFDNEKKALELEKLKFELEKLKSEEKETKTKRTRKPKKEE